MRRGTSVWVGVRWTSRLEQHSSKHWEQSRSSNRVNTGAQRARQYLRRQANRKRLVVYGNPQWTNDTAVVVDESRL